MNMIVRNKIVRNKPVIYFAGKIAKCDWRTEITGDNRVGGLAWDGGAPIEHMFDPDYRVEYDHFCYGGPFFISCDHGCGHVERHALGGCFGEESGVDRSKILMVNTQRIIKADYMFTFINEVNCFGTLIELGIALQQPTLRTAVAFGPNVSIAQYKDLWMAEQCAQEVYTGPVKYAWQKFAAHHLSFFIRGAA
jgi:hypothetical protein